MAPLSNGDIVHNKCPFEDPENEAQREELHKIHREISHNLACVKLEKVREEFQKLLMNQYPSLNLKSVIPTGEPQEDEKERNFDIADKVEALTKVPKKERRKIKPKETKKEWELSQIQDLQ